MSKANTHSQGSAEDSQIRRLYVQFIRNLPSSQLQDRKGYPLNRQLSTSEQQRFIQSLTLPLQEYISKRRDTTRLERQEADLDYDPQTWDEEDEALQEPTDEEGERERETDLLSYNDRFMGLDIAEIPYSIQDTLSEERLLQLEAAPSYKQREAVWDYKRKRGKRNRFVPTEQLQVWADKRLASSARQEAQIRAYLNRPTITYHITINYYLDPRPGTWKGFVKR